MAPSQLDSITADKAPTATTQENKPPIPIGAGAKKAMEPFFTGVNMEFRQRSSSASRSTLKTSSRGSTPSREVASGNRDNSVDAEMLSSALKKMPTLEKNPYRPTPPRSRSISRAESPLPASELLDESLPDFYKVTLKKTERTGSQTRDILLDGTRPNVGAAPLTGDVDASPKFRRGSSSFQTQNIENEEAPEFRRVVLRRTPSKEQLDDEATLRASSRKSNVVTGSTKVNMSRSGSFTSLTSINKAVLSRRTSISNEDRPEFLDVRLKKSGSRAASPDGDDAFHEGGSNSASMSRSSSYTTLSAINKANWSRRSSISSTSEEAPAFKGVSLKKTDSKQDLRSDSPTKATTTTEAEFANINLKKSKRVQSDQSKFKLESVSLKPIPIGAEEEVESCSTVEFSSMERVAKARVERATKFESGDDEYLDIQSSLAKLKSGKTAEEEEHLKEENRIEREAWEKTEREEKERLRKEREAKARKEKEERDTAERETRERREKRVKEQKERVAKEQKEKEEMEKKLREEMEKKREEMERKRKEKEEIAKEEKAQKERETKEKEEKEKHERQEREKNVKEEKEKKAREEKEKQEQEGNERKIREERVKKEIEERATKEKIERQQKVKEKKVNEAEEQERKEHEKQERKERIRLEIEGRVKHKLEEKEKKEKEREERIEDRVERESTSEDAAAKPGFYRRRRSSEEKKEAAELRRANLKKRMSFTSSFENINLASQPEHEKVHLSVFTREMGSNHDLVQISQDHGEGKHEVKLEFQIKKDEKETTEVMEESEEEMSESEEVVVIKKVERRESRLVGESKLTGALEDEVVSNKAEEKLHTLRKAPSVDGLFQTQEVNAAFTFKLPPPENTPQMKLSFEIPNLA